jgi:hypothetical protein
MVATYAPFLDSDAEVPTLWASLDSKAPTAAEGLSAVQAQGLGW